MALTLVISVFCTLKKNLHLKNKLLFSLNTLKTPVYANFTFFRKLKQRKLSFQRKSLFYRKWT